MNLRNNEECQVEGETQRSGDDWGVEADGSGANAANIARGWERREAGRWCYTLQAATVFSNYRRSAAERWPRG